ncbi:hypothetical protein EJ02DRAFT_247648 [Clathrospora elynae]|uniref:Uncharacterized protein n=1 Tax=Clathrospora elynae TaxID=706981 RepID=A0A6A5T1V9_9PLEO|nr:hypothetical protein EJ02DRAFT_247648 [Clathrospora elynae]
MKMLLSCCDRHIHCPLLHMVGNCRCCDKARSWHLLWRLFLEHSSWANFQGCAYLLPATVGAISVVFSVVEVHGRASREVFQGCIPQPRFHISQRASLLTLNAKGSGIITSLSGSDTGSASNRRMKFPRRHWFSQQPEDEVPTAATGIARCAKGNAGSRRSP